MTEPATTTTAHRLLMQFHRWGVNRSTGSLLIRIPRWTSWGAFISLLVLRNPRVRGHRVVALTRLWTWQLWRRLVRRPVLVSLEGGVKLLMPPWSTLAGVVAATGSHEPVEQAFLAHLVRPGDFAIDVGANIGIHALVLAGLGATVAAFEPATVARAVLLDNVRLNGADRTVRVFPFALGDHDGEASLTTDLDGANHLAGPGETTVSTEPVAVRTLDGVVSADPELPERDLVVIKVDAEGHDELVLRGARGLIERQRPVILVETWDGGRRIRDLLETMGYRVFRYDLDQRDLIEYPRDWSGQANFIAVHSSRHEEVLARLASARALVGGLPEIRWTPDAVGVR